MIISKCICLFVIYSFLGWIYETLYCTIKTGHWEKRGFLYGPICPIYGVGAILISIISRLLPSNMEMKQLGVFFIAFLGSMVLEFVTSLGLELLFHAVWWDYYDVPLNIQGRTSIPTGIAFGFAGIFVVDLLSPNVELMVGSMTMVSTECGALAAVAVFSADMTLTISALTNMARIIEQMDESINNRMERLVESAQRKTGEIRDQIAFESMGNIRRLALKRVKDFRYPMAATERIKKMLRWQRIIKKKSGPGDGSPDQK